VFRASSKALVATQLARREEEEQAQGGGGRQRRGRASQTVGRGFLASLKRLMEALEATEAHFIRCIKPNNELKPNLLYGAFVLSQLKCSGTLEAVELMQRGYPSRIPYEDIHARCAPLMADLTLTLTLALALTLLLPLPLPLPLPLTRYAPLMGDFVAELGAQVNGPGQALRPSQFVEAIAMAFGLQEEDYQLGEHKIFLRSGAPKYGRPVPLELVHCPTTATLARQGRFPRGANPNLDPNARP